MSQRAGSYAWAGLVAYVASYDVVAFFVGLPTLSATFYGASERRRNRFALLLVWGYLTAHLFRWVPARYDVLRLFDKPRR
ncbi:MAG: DUF7427 family protein [Pontimonas sp.]